MSSTRTELCSLGREVLGRVSIGGEFIATAVLYAGLGPQAPRPELGSDKYVVLLSGLNVGSEMQ